MERLDAHGAAVQGLGSIVNLLIAGVSVAITWRCVRLTEVLARTATLQHAAQEAAATT